MILFSSPRSGSTLLANLVRSHPRIWYFNEIFTRAPELLPRFEAAFQQEASDLRAAFEQDLQDLEPYKLAHFHNLFHWNRLVKTLVFLFPKAVASAESRMKLQCKTWTAAYKTYYINALHEPPLRPFFELQFPKAKNCDVLFVKDVRMRKAYLGFKSMYPESLFIYLIRNPFFVVASELQHHQYADLMRWLDPVFLCHAFQQPHLVDRYFGKSPEHTFALVWRLENELIYRDWTTSRLARKMLVRYEDLMRDPKQTVIAIFESARLSYDDQTERLLKALAGHPGQQKHSRSVFVKAGSSSRSQPNLNREQHERVRQVVDDSALMDLWAERSEGQAIEFALRFT